MPTKDRNKARKASYKWRKMKTERNAARADAQYLAELLSWYSGDSAEIDAALAAHVAATGKQVTK